MVCNHGDKIAHLQAQIIQTRQRLADVEARLCEIYEWFEEFSDLVPENSVKIDMLDNVLYHCLCCGTAHYAEYCPVCGTKWGYGEATNEHIIKGSGKQ